ncbi:MAG TPA: hypothetical protein VMZ69_05835, partial [Saprospiraceae bacterium]|nr:hypothetical protein [Saprospiraceae bacterium]
MKAICFVLLFIPLLSISQEIYNFPVNDINELIRTGAAQVSHDQFDIGSISDVFDGNTQSLARSAAINPLTITLEFDFPVTFGGTSILQSYSNGWWTIEAADSQYDLDSQGLSYVKLFEESSLLDAVPDEITFAPITKRVIRLTVMRTTGDDYVHLNEWQLLNAQAEVEITSVCIRPSEIWLLPNQSTEVKLLGTSGDATYDLTSDVAWFTNNQVVATVMQTNDKTIVTAGSQTGSATLIGNWKFSLQNVVTVHVVEDFKPIVPPSRTVKVALVIIDPPIDAEGGRRFHERFGWTDPVALTEATMDSLDAASEGAVDYQIVSTYDEDSLYAIYQGHRISVDSMYRLFLEPGWVTFHQLEQNGGYAFDYNGLLAAHDFCTLSNSKEIDEVWVYSMPFTGMYESRLTGEGAFWYNSPPLDGNSCFDQLPIMGLNYERGVAEALHSFGHRVESAMVHTYGRWDYNAVDKNDWEKFASYDAVVPGGAHIGNIHFPPNAVSDYDYGNPSTVITFADNWKYYPFLFDKQRQVTCSEWDC